MTRFDTTRWSVVLRAGASTADARPALEVLCRTYRPPVLAYIRSRGHSSEAAEDLAQSFFEQLLEHAFHASADPARGRFRVFLLMTLQRFLTNAQAEATAQKRGGHLHFDRLPLNGLGGGDVPDAGDSPERAFERGWAFALIDAALHRLRAEAERAGKVALFDELTGFLIERPDEAEYARVAEKLKLRRNTLAVAVHRLRERLRRLVRAELAQTAASKGELETELRELRAALADIV